MSAAAPLGPFEAAKRAHKRGDGRTAVVAHPLGEVQADVVRVAGVTYAFTRGAPIVGAEVL